MMDDTECQAVQAAIQGHIPVPMAAIHEPTATWISIDNGVLQDLVAGLEQHSLDSLDATSDEMGWAVCGCMDCHYRSLITHLLPRILLAIDEGLIRHARSAN